MRRPESTLRVVGWLLLPACLLVRQASFAAPATVERLYSRQLYPLVASVLWLPARLLPFSIAEVVILLLSATAVVCLGVGARLRWRRGVLWPTAREAIGVVWLLWTAAGAVLALFLLVWGLHYSRPTLATRLELSTDGIEAREVLSLGREMAVEATRLHALLGSDPAVPTTMPLAFGQLSDLAEVGIRKLQLPGDRVPVRLPPAKRVFFSGLLAHLGISGIYVPFTGEPSVNGLVPDASLPVVVAHEKAHQHGITDEGEANLVGILACLGSTELYLRYAATLTAASQLIGSTSRYLPEETAEAWTELGDGPRRDLRAIREFWDSYRGTATRVAGRVNDAYLRGNRVPGGVESYGRVVTLLVALDRSGRLVY